MELNLARIVYEHAEPPQQIIPVVERTQVNIPGTMGTLNNAESINTLEATIAREGFMVQVVA